jgi:hypothetical protein
MANEAFAGNYDQVVELDICHACNGIWFDGLESLALTPGSVIKLFRSMHESHDQSNQALREQMHCPRCKRALLATLDMQRTTRFNYQRCDEGCGRFITFLQWLREKNFVRDLDTKQLNMLRTQLKVIQCSNCGAPVDIQARSVCEYCRAPITALDPSAVAQTLQQLQQAETKRTAVDTNKTAQMIKEQLYLERWAKDDWSASGDLNEPVVELVAIGLGVLFDLLT